MPVNRNALIRYKTIDTCLRNRFRQWTLNDLIDACSDALNEYEGIDKGISRRTVQMDIQMMRSEKLGYNAPIVVYDTKYYTYEDENYSITNTPLSEQDLRTMSEAVEVLRQFKGFSYFTEMSNIVSRLEDHVTSAKTETTPVIDFEKNDNLQGLDYLDTLYQAIVNQQALLIGYRSFRAKSAQNMVVHPYLLKEYRNRWFLFGRQNGTLVNLALDRMLSIEEASGVSFLPNDLFEPETFFDDVVGVSKNKGMSPSKVTFWVDAANAPYVQTKPIHHSQTVVEAHVNGSTTFQIEVVITPELTRELLGFADALKVVSPRSLVDELAKKLEKASRRYED